MDSVADVPRGVTVEYGEYLAGPVGHCVECHSPSRPVKESELGQGGFVFDGPWGVTVSANITSHEDGLAGYSDAEIADMITKGMRPDGSRMSPPMGFPFYAKMHEDDLAAIIMYLRALPPLPDKE